MNAIDSWWAAAAYWRYSPLRNNKERVCTTHAFHFFNSQSWRLLLLVGSRDGFVAVDGDENSDVEESKGVAIRYFAARYPTTDARSVGVKTRSKATTSAMSPCHHRDSSPAPAGGSQTLPSDRRRESSGSDGKLRECRVSCTLEDGERRH